ncbi:lipoate--protein ligase family protein [Salinirarus marinus]|uniref:lipoate--protein ligase family protein n=1 Tax=Salinirarus marinus TaxID=3068310 RepID=UPI003C6C62D2
MRVLRGRGDTPESDRARTAELLDRTAETGEAGLRVWTPHRQVAFGRRDAHADGYAEARRIAESRGFAPVERSVGGHAVAYSGRTLAFAYAVPTTGLRVGLDARYESAVEALGAALASLGVDARRGEPPDAFCPGDHSLRAGGKLAGLAQRVRADAALVAGCLLVCDHDVLASVLAPVYDALGLAFDPASVGSVAGSGGPEDPEAVARALERAFIGGDVARIATVD